MHNRSSSDIKVTCSYCTKQERVQDVTLLKKGQHIATPGYYGRKYSPGKRKLTSLYQHHAIITDVHDFMSTSEVEMTLIHFQKEDNVIKISQNKQIYKLIKDEIYLVHHRYCHFEPDEIVRRAEEMYKTYKTEGHLRKKYNFITYNCEHFANWCVVGNSQSPQVGKIRALLRTGIGSVTTYTASAVVRAFPQSNCAMATIIGLFFIYYIYCIGRTMINVHYYSNGTICWACLKNKMVDLWTKFYLFFISNILIRLFWILKEFMDEVFFIILLIISTFLLWLIHWNIPNIRRSLQSPISEYNCTKINNTSEIERGDIISFRYIGFYHILIIDSVSDKTSSSSCILNCFHYWMQGLCRWPCIVKEHFPIDLPKTTVYRYDFNNLRCFCNEDVIKRASKRLGEIKWNIFSNRSGHFCFWAKVQQQRHEVIIDERTERNQQFPDDQIFSSLEVEEVEVHLKTDIKRGDALHFKTWGIVCDIRSRDNKEREFEIQRVFYDRRWRVRKSDWIAVDLKFDKVKIRKYHPAHCYPMKIRWRRALFLFSNGCKSWTTRGFLEECIAKYSTLKHNKSN